MPLTGHDGKRRRVYPFEVFLPVESVATGRDSIVMPQQIRTTSKRRLLERIGALTDEALRVDIENRVLDHLGL